MSEEQADYTTYSGFFDHKGMGNGKLYKWVGYMDLSIKVKVDAISEAEALEKMRDAWIDRIKSEEKPFIVFNTWEVVDEEI